jgi:hypothetical protein
MTLTTRRRRLALEPLETRTLLAGNVSVDEVGGNLKLRGDEECNGVLIVQLGSGRYAVVGFDHDGAPTTINGGADPVIVRGIKHNFLIDLRQGDDLLGIGNNVELLADLATELGFEDVLNSGDLPAEEIPDVQLRVPKSLIVHTKDGEDGVVMTADVRYDAIVHTGKHADGIAFADSDIGDDVILRTDKGQDGVLLENIDVDGHLNVHTGHDGDTLLVSLSSVRHAVLNTGHGSDSLGVSETEFARELVLLAEQGNDDVIVNVVAADRIHLDSGSGNDQVGLAALAIDDDLIIHTHGGDDTVEISDSDVDDLFAAFLGTDDDVLSIGGSSARKALLRGGPDFDILNVDSLSFAGKIDREQFEDVNSGMPFIPTVLPPLEPPAAL